MKKSFFFIIFSFLTLISYGQLPNFQLNVTSTNETCTGNGSLSFNVTNTAPNATILYSIYLLPDVTTPIATLPGNTYTGLSAGNYRIVALQSLGNLSNTQSQDIQINNLIQSLSYQLTGQNVSCQTVGSITANVTQGTPVSYEIISGPIIVPPQASNVFANLPAGAYNVRVNDNCGDGVVQTYTIVNIPPIPNIIISPLITTCELVDCNTISGSYTIGCTPNTTILYPLTIQFTVNPPNGGTPIVFNQILNSGQANLETVQMNIPFFHAQAYTYNIRIVDACGNLVTLNGQIEEELTLDLSKQAPDSCQRIINLKLCNFVPPYTVSFLSTPIGFDPLLYNSNHPGPFNDGSIAYTSTTQQVPDGNYLIQVTDACGRVAQNSITISNSPPDFVLEPAGDPCDPIYVLSIPNEGPLVTLVTLVGAPPILNLTLPQEVYNNPSGGIYSTVLTAAGVYTFTGTNICGNTFTFNVEIPPLEPPTITATANATVGCSGLNGTISIIINGGPKMVSVMLIQAPTSFSQSLPLDVSQFILNPSGLSFLMTNLPVGDYVFTITDSCGNLFTPVTASVPLIVSENPLSVFFIRGCEIGFSSIRLISPNTSLQTVIITAAPASFPFPLPYDVSFNIATNGRFYMNSFPQGGYNFYSKDQCNVERNTFINMPGYAETINNITVQGNCGSFNLVMQHVVNESNEHFYWLQRLDPITNQWGHPLTGVAYVDGTVPTALNSYPLINLSTNYNIAAAGTFRVIKSYAVFSNGVVPITNCLKVIKEFEYNGNLRIISAYTFPCSNGSNEVLLVAEGIPPLSYKITSKNGQPFFIDNGSSNLFTGLQPAIYNFQVQDQCGNIVNRLFDITALPDPVITADDLCDGQVGQLSVQAISFLNYQWWKGNDTTTILSTTNVLQFNPFSSFTSPGTYYVRIYSTSALSCVDKIISYVVPAFSNPNAGQDAEITICDSIAPINLTTLLTLPFDNGGTWEELSNSGVLNGNIWQPLGIPYGVYTFKYTVTGFCDQIDESIITINFNQGPSIPVINYSASLCEGEEINLTVNSIPNATFDWVGPNNFSSTGQSVVIPNSSLLNAGMYTVTASLNGCQTTSSVEVTVNPIPIFTINNQCVNGLYTITVIPTDNSFDPNLVTYSWTGPNNFSSTNNPITITNSVVGLYTVTVTNQNSCSSTDAIQVLSTLCEIPNIITPNNDENNDSFDLSGLGVERFEIYSRWGRLVYEENNYIDSWHGQNMNNEPLPDSTYYYILTLQSGEEKHGWVFIVR